jgi:hypothetical protein
VLEASRQVVLAGDHATGPGFQPHEHLGAGASRRATGPEESRQYVRGRAVEDLLRVPGEIAHSALYP